MNEQIIQAYQKMKLYKPIFNIISFWKKIGHKSIYDNDDVFKHIILSLQNLAIEGLKFTDKKYSELLDQIYRNIGWLGEQLLIEQIPEKKPLMMDYEYITNYESLLECIYSIGSELQEHEKDGYPLIFFDAVYVIIKKIIDNYDEYYNIIDYNKDIFQLSYVYSSYAQKAIEVENSKGFSLAVLRISEILRLLKENDINTSIKDIVEMLVDLAYYSSTNSDKLKVVEFIGKKVHIWIMDELLFLEKPAVVERAVNSRYMSFHPIRNRNAMWEFIKEFGMKLGTNFNFMFDWTTGEDYPAEDSRRKLPPHFQYY